MKALIVEDELLSARMLKGMLNEVAPEIAVIGVAPGVKIAVEQIQEYKPELLFLDIELPDGLSFEIIRQCSNIPFKIIFITAYDHFALQAIKCSAVDYLLKPLDKSELINALKKLKPSEASVNAEIPIENLLKNTVSTKAENLVVPIKSGYEVFPFSEIVYFQANGSYTKVVTTSRTEILSKNLKYFEQVTEGLNFIRVHDSYLVNKDYIQRLQMGSPAKLLLRTGDSVPVSSRKIAQVKRDLF